MEKRSKNARSNRSPSPQPDSSTEVVDVECKINDSWEALEVGSATNSSADSKRPRLCGGRSTKKLGETDTSLSQNTGKFTKKWTLQKFIGGVLTGKLLDLEEIGFPICIGKNPLKVQILLNGGAKKSVDDVHVELLKVDNELHLLNHSPKGVLVNDNTFLKMGHACTLKNGDIFCLGISSCDVQFENKTVVFAVQMKFERRQADLTVESDEENLCPQSSAGPSRQEKNEPSKESEEKTKPTPAECIIDLTQTDSEDSPSYTHSRENERHEKCDWSFDHLRNLLLNMNLTSKSPNETEASFIQCLDNGFSCESIEEIRHFIVSYFALEGIARLQHAWKRPVFEDSQQGEVINHYPVNSEVVRLKILMHSSGRRIFSEFSPSSAVRLTLKGGQFTTKSELLMGDHLGIIHKVEQIDYPIEITKKKRAQGKKIVLDVDVNLRSFKSLHIPSTKFELKIFKLCDLRELQKVLHIESFPKPYHSFLSRIQFKHVWTPQKYLKSTRSSHADANVSSPQCRKLSSEQQDVLRTALHFSTLKPEEAMFMLVEGAAGTGKTFTLMETALEVAFANPGKTVLVFCKWTVAADKLTLRMHELVVRRNLKLNGKLLNISRGGISRHEQVIPLTVHGRYQQLAGCTVFDGVQKKSKTSFADILESSNVLICASSDIETNILGNAFDRSGTTELPLILIDQAQQILLVDLVPIMQLNSNKIVMFGDRHQSDYRDQIIRHALMKKLKPFTPSEFVKLCRSFEKFQLTTQFRLSEPLQSIVNELFYKAKSKPPVKTFARGNSLANLTLIDLYGFEKHKPNQQLNVLMKIITTLTEASKCIYVLRSSYSNFRLIGALEEKFREKHSAVVFKNIEIMDVDDIDILVVPSFDEGLGKNIAKDANILCSLMTRPRKAFIMVGFLEQMESQSDIIVELTEQGKIHHRYIKENCQWFEENSPHTILHYFFP